MSDKCLMAPICNFFKKLFSGKKTENTASDNDGLTSVERYIRNKSSDLTGVEKYIRNKATNSRPLTGVESYVRNKTSTNATSVENYIQNKG